MKTKNIIKLITICSAFYAAGLSAKNPFKGDWINSMTSYFGGGTTAKIGDKSLEVGFWGPGGMRYEAAYTVQGDSLHYTVTEGGDQFYDPEKKEMVSSVGKKGICKIVKINDSLFFQEQLKCTGPIGDYLKEDGGIRKANVFRGLLPKDTPRKIHGIETLSILKSGNVNDTAYLRSAPDVSAKPLNCILREPVKNSEETKKIHEGHVIPKSTKLFVIGRTKTKVKVQKWDNYWYYIDGSNRPLDSECGPGWVYGEFITIK